MSEELILSDYERRALIAHYETESLLEFHKEKEDDLWYGYQIGDRMFDLNIWVDDLTGDVVCTVYECDWVKDNWQTNTKRSWTLTDVGEMVSYDFTLDNILSVKAPRNTDPDTLHEAVRDKLITLIQGKHECFMFEGTFEEDSND